MYPWIWWESCKAEGLYALSLVKRNLSNLDIDLTVKMITLDNFAYEAIKISWERAKDSGRDLRLTSTYKNALKFKKLFLEYNEEKINFQEAGSLKQINDKFLAYNKERLLKHSTIEPYKH